MEITILLPCLNEEKTVGDCVREAVGFLEENGLTGEVLVVDNGSTDASVSLAKQAGARVISCHKKGYGNALRHGISSAHGTYVIMGDCDCSYRFDKLMPFVEALRGGADMIIGDRFALPMEKGAMSFSHRIGVPFLSWLGRCRYRCKMKDFHCGLRAVCRESFLKLSCTSEGMEFATEMIGRASLAGQRISQLPVKLYCDKREGKSHLRTIRDGFRHIGVMMNTTAKAVLTAVVTAVVCILMLFATGLIPQSAIKEACAESAQFFMERELFEDMVPGQFNTRRDNYADSILLNVMYHISGEDTFRSLIRASYYHPDFEEVNISFYDSLQEVKEPNVDYFRYWHGSMVLLRPLFLLTGIEGARLTLGIVLFVLIAAAVAFLWRLSAKEAAVIYLLGNIVVQVWMCLFCIEYITTFLVANGVLLIELCMFAKRKSPERLRSNIVLLMAASGVITCFVDFLTTETLTVTVPLFFLLILLHEAGELRSVKEEVKYLVGCGTAWGLSYAGMFLLKWLLAAMVLGAEAFGAAMSAAGERIGGNVYLGNSNLDPEAGVLERVVGLLGRNQGSLFPFQYEMSMGAAMCLFLGLCLLCFIIVYMLRPNKMPVNTVCICLLLGAVPYLRYLVLQNHSYIHYFFTYRAQLVTVLAIAYLTWGFGIRSVIGRKKK